MATEYQFKLATAKDLPPAWYELVLRPETFQEHLNNLYQKPHVEPSALLLIATFLEKAACIEGQSPLGEGVTVSEEKKQTLIDCALFMGTFLKWDFSSIEQGLPPAVVHSLFSSLAAKFPLSSSIIVDVPVDVLTAQTLYNLWVIRFLVQSDLPIRSPPQGLLWEGTCASPDIIKQLVQPELDKAISILTDVCLIKHDFKLPCQSLELPYLKGLGKGEEKYIVQLPFNSIGVSYQNVHTQLHYDLGQILFQTEQYQKSHDHFKQCSELLDKLKGKIPQPHLLINRDKLKGYLAACESLEGDEPKYDTPLVAMATIEQHRKGNMEDILDYLPSCPSTLSAAYRVGLESDVFDWSESVAMETSKNKRPKLESGISGRGLSLSIQLCIWDVIQCIVDGKGMKPTSLNTLSSSDDNKDIIDYILTTADKVLKDIEPGGVVSNQLILFLKSIYVNNILWNECIENYPLIKQLMGIDKLKTKLSKPSDFSSIVIPSNNPFNRLVPILLSPTPSILMTAVSDLFHQTPASEHVPIANMLQGDSREFSSVHQMTNPLVCAQYNALLQKANIQADMKDYESAVEFYTFAFQLINSVSNPNSFRLVPVLMEQSLRMRILAAGVGLNKLTNTKACELHSTLINDAKNHYSNNKNPNIDPLNITLTGVFLLNLQQYFIVARYDHTALHERVCTRLAVAAQCMKEGHDLRRCTRDLFETVSGIFSTPRGGGNKSDENQLQRKCLEVILTHLQDPMCLSYLMAALVRLWNLIKKPAHEISSEYLSHWPTAVGNASSIKTDQVLRVLESTLSNSIKFHPSHNYWLIMKGDISFANNNYGTALQSYLEAGAQDSDFFIQPVSVSVWNQQVYHRMIKCCCGLEYFSQAIVLCQFLDSTNYTFTFTLLKEHACHVLESIFDYLWDMNIIEYLIYSLSKQGESVIQATAVQTAGRPELNTHNHRSILTRVVEVRKRQFLKHFYRIVVLKV